jgi:hypothetical protein
LKNLFFIVSGIEGNMDQAKYIRAREKRWAREDSKRDLFRKFQSEQVPAKVLERLRAKWIRSDYARINYRVGERKKYKPDISDIHELRRAEDAETAKRYKKEDKRREQSRIKQDEEIAARRLSEETKRDQRRKQEDLHCLVREDRLGSPGTNC